MTGGGSRLVDLGETSYDVLDSLACEGRCSRSLDVGHGLCGDSGGVSTVCSSICCGALPLPILISSWVSPSDISNMRSCTEVLPTKAGARAGLLASLDVRLRLRCREGDAATSSRLWARKEDDRLSLSAYLFESTIASTFARL